MVRRFRRRIVRRRRRVVRRRRRIPRNINRYDGNVLMKCFATKDWTVSANKAQMKVMWFSNQDVANASFLDCFNSDEYKLLAARFTECRVKYMRIQVMVNQQVNTLQSGMAGAAFFQNIQIGSAAASADATMVTSDNLIRTMDYRTYTPNRTITRNYKVNKYLRSRGYDWVLSANQPAAQIATFIYMDTGDYGNTSIVGNVTVTYYMQFRGAVI